MRTMNKNAVNKIFITLEKETIFSWEEVSHFPRIDSNKLIGCFTIVCMCVCVMFHSNLQLSDGDIKEQLSLLIALGKLQVLSGR